ncbi:hypothetical protein B0T18DRAFT_411428 [Schizothecium vesticola]|uniref:Uncharacterized protein n=1 Tax=Schizothecium vesticola TaxID=314040 RepID=A0AA40EVK0_9PEZI|nr:hypothetical protein B0T18DRAFT_411428 [Schizothecium vesticola]
MLEAKAIEAAQFSNISLPSFSTSTGRAPSTVGKCHPLRIPKRVFLSSSSSSFPVHSIH